MQEAPARLVSGGPTAGPAQARGGPTQAAPELTIVIPTFNERENVPLLVERLRAVLQDCAWEVIFVDDDSPDGTADLAKTIGVGDARVRCLRRIGRRGLSGACLEGMLASQARFVAVMDADLQHDETLLVSMLAALRGGAAELVVGTRYAPGGASEGFSARRLQLSQLATQMARAMLHVALSDPMSGFFMMRRAVVDEIAPSLSSQGFKLLVDIVATARPLRIVELPYAFRQRRHGESKLDLQIALDFAALLVAKLSNDAVSVRFLMFCLVGLTGVAVHMAALQLAVVELALRFSAAQAVATVTAITWNFTLNNLITYRDQRLAGWRFLTGLVRFQLVCAVGAISNVGAASWIYDSHTVWWIAGLGGALMGAVWNYVVSAAFVWRVR
jgi:dolichol-phosphate mannosyltransferase